MASIDLSTQEQILASPSVRAADERVFDAMDKITGWRIRKKGGVPRRKMDLCDAWADAMADYTLALIRATRRVVLSRKSRSKN